MKKSTRLLSLLLVVVMLVGYAVPVQAAHNHETTVEGESLAFEQSESNISMDLLHEVEETEEEALYADTDIVRVSIVLEKESTIEAGFSTENIATNAEAVSYREELQTEQETLTANIETALGEELDVVWNLTLAANIISANVQYGQIEQIETVAGVKDVFLETQYEPAVVKQEETVDPNMATSSNQIGSFTAWTNGYTGAGSRIAIIDTGSDTDHQSFSGAGLVYSLQRNAEAEEMTAEAYMASLNLLDAEEIASVLDQLHISDKYTAEDLYLNEKLAFGYNYVDEDLDIGHDNDDEGSHGSHVAGIATANTYIPNGDGTFAKALDTVYMQGVAPDAQLITMKVFGKAGGAWESDYMVAIEDAIVLGCDSVNLSLGSSSSGFVTSSTYQEIMESLTKSGTVVAMAVGNDYAWAQNGTAGTLPYANDINFNTVGSPGSYTNSMGVASVQNAGQTGNYFQVNGTNFCYNHYTKEGWTNAPLTTLAGEHEYVFLDGGHAGLDSEWEEVADVLKGKIAICYRGTISFYQKAEYAVKHGAIGVIVCNNVDGTINMDLTSYTQTAPCVSITLEQSRQLLAMSTRVDGDDGYAKYYTGKMTISDKVGVSTSSAEYYTMSDFSSWGVPSSLTMKPEITAPGGGIYSVNGVDTSGKAYENNSGTSMATPQVTGMVAVIAEYIRENDLVAKTGLTARQLAQSLLMSTAVPVKEEKTAYYYSVLKQGSGLANVGAAVTANSYIMMDENATASYADGKVKAELGEDAKRKGEYTFSFTLNNLTDTARGYTLAADIFTQDLSSSGKYLSAQTKALAADVTYLVDGKLFTPTAGVSCDLDGDGDTDADDAKIVLNYCVGLTKEINPIADVNKDNAITSYDAYLILTSMGTSEITLPAGGKVNVTVKIVLPESLKAELDAAYVNGAYLEGYVWVKPTSTEEGVYTDVTHSIPVLGFYGSWTDPSMYERVNYMAQLYGDKTTAYTTAKNTNVLTLKHKGETNAYYQVGNPYLVEDTMPTDRMAINSTTKMNVYRVTLIRNAAYLAGFVMNEAGEVLYVANPTPQVFGAYYYASSGVWYSTSASATVGKTPAKLGFKEGDKVTAGVVAIPEYYAMNGELSTDDIKKLIEDDVLGEGAYQTTTMLVDNTAPTVTNVVKYTEGEGVTITASDNNYIAAIQVADEDGMVLTTVAVPNQTEKNQTVTVNVDLTDLFVGEKCIIGVADYAGNVATYSFRYGGENKYIVPGTMFAWTKSKDRGETVARWTQIDVPTLWYGDTENYSGTTTVAKTSYEDNTYSAEYVDGYVFFVCEDGYIYRTRHGKWTNEKVFANWEEAVDTDAKEKIYDITADHYNKKVWLCSNLGNIYELNMDNGEITLAFNVSLSNPNISKASSSNAQYRTPRSIIVDDTGRFYAFNYPGKIGYTYLYTWTLDDVVTTTNEDGTVTRAITDLAPINNSKAGSIPQPRFYIRLVLAYDHDKDIIYATPTDNSTTGRDDHTLFIVNRTDGSVTPANSYLPQGETDGSAIIHSSCYGLYIVPTDKSGILPDVFTATSVKINAPRTDVLVGATMTLTADVGPWNLDDKSVTWSSADESVATVDSDGTVTFHTTGKVSITATTVLKPFLQDTVEITVGTYPADTITAAIGKADGTYHIADFSPANLNEVTSIKELDRAFMGGGYHDGKIWYHDGSAMFALDRDTLVLESKGDIPKGAAWSDSTTEPLLEVDTFNNLIALSNDGFAVLIWNEATGYTRTYDITRHLDDDPAALIACADYRLKNNTNFGYDFYVLTEGGTLMRMYLWCSTLADTKYYYQDFDDYPMYATGLELMGVASVGSGNYGSMIYDEDTGYLLVTRTLKGQGTALYAIDPNNGVTAPVGTFSDEISYVTGMYKYDRADELTVSPKTNTVEMYADETYDLGIRILPYTNSQEFTCVSSDETVATVDNKGIITAKAAGTATITITSKAVNEAGQNATAQVTVNVTALKSMTTEFHAQITDATGTYWAKINTSDLSITKEGTASVALSGAGAHNGKIYGSDSDYVTDDGHLYVIDPSNGYSATQGAAVSAEQAVLDGTTMPLLITNAVNNDKSTELFETGNFPAYLNADKQMKLLANLETGEHAPYLCNLTNARGLAAVAYAGLGKASKYDAHVYYLLENDGDVHRFLYYPKYASNKLTYANSFGKNAFNVGEIFQNKYKVTMTYIDDGTNKGLLIADSSNTETELFFVDMSGTTYTTSKIGTLRGVTNLVGAYTDSEIAPPTTEEEGTRLPVETEVADADVSSVESEAVESVNETVDAPVFTQNEVAEPNAAGGLTLVETADSTNGKIVITYDPTQLDYVSCMANVKPFAINVDETAGVITYAYASETQITAGDALATLVFTYLKDYVETEIKIETKERNDKIIEDEEPRIVKVVYGQKCEHNYEVTDSKDPTCTEAGYKIYTCTKCGDSYREDLPANGSHTFGDWEVVKAATCTEKGQEKRTCSGCGEIEYRDVEAAGHNYEKTVTEPTCTEKGYTTYTCSVCGDSYVDDYVDAKGHSFGDWEVVKAATCTEKGQEKRVCSGCGETEYRDIEATGHNYEKTVTAPTCTEYGYTTYTCSGCQDSYEGDFVNPTGHSYKDTVTEPTCTAIGYTTHTCTVCGHSYVSDYVAAKGHAFGEWTVVTEPTCTTKGQEKRVCSVCGETEYRDVKAKGHVYTKTVTEPTCTAYGYTTFTCSCGESYVAEYVPAKGHAYNKVVTEPTCTDFGYTTYTCSACGDKYVSDYIPAKGHDYKKSVTEPTCTEMGYTTYTCSVCGDSYKSDYVNATGHTFGDWVVTTPATCTEDGVETRTCVCGETETRAIEATGHTFGDWTVTKAATCTEDGTETRTCACGETETRAIAATGHSFGEWTVTKAATCTEKGEETRTCACGETETRKTDALGHDCTAVTVDPTCTADGYTEYTCKVCGYSYRDDVVKATGHDYEATVTAPTCTADGYTTYTCKVCGDSYVADYVDALGHTFGDWTVTKAATCTEDGVETRTCACGETETRTIKATGHNFGDWTVTTEPTCTEKGEETRTCACGETEKREIAALGHDYTVKTVEATCTTDGYTEYTCKVCGYSYREDIVPATGHDYEAVVTAPTCTEDGYTTYICNNCGDSYVADYVDALGHDFSDWVITTEATCTTDGVKTRTCTVCGETETEVVPAYCPTADYTDVPLDAWYHEAVDYVVDNGIMEGTEKNVFNPTGTTTRAQLVTVLYRLAGTPDVETTDAFTDVPADAWFAKAVAWAYAEGITTGTSATTFSPNAAVTREQVVVFMARYAEYAGIDTASDADLSNYKDAAMVNSYAVSAFAWAVENGIITGVTADTLMPQGTSNRAQIATILMRFMELYQ